MLYFRAFPQKILAKAERDCGCELSALLGTLERWSHFASRNGALSDKQSGMVWYILSVYSTHLSSLWLCASVIWSLSSISVVNEAHYASDSQLILDIFPIRSSSSVLCVRLCIFCKWLSHLTHVGKTEQWHLWLYNQSFPSSLPEMWDVLQGIFGICSRKFHHIHITW